MFHGRSENRDFTPAIPCLGAYDPIVRIFAGEGRWRARLLEQLAPCSSDVIADIGCGTGSQLTLVGKTSPSARLIGIDPDQRILDMASAKLARSGVSARLCRGYLREVDSILPGASVTKIVSSLVFHQVPLAEKEAGLRSIIEVLTPGGELHIADYGLQRSTVMRALFRLVQCVDGFADTQPNADGVLPDLMRLAGFIDVEETAVFPTSTGSISLYRGRKPELDKPLHRTRSSF
jgi:SAM-dependent methyltransferase